MLQTLQDGYMMDIYIVDEYYKWYAMHATDKPDSPPAKHLIIKNY